ncbi:MAG: hypothetical protein AAB401_22190 [Acidobacteriota bacterium]
MAKVKIKIPEHSPEERKRLLDELMEKANDNEGIESLIERMNGFEQEYGMSTIEFYARFVAGKMGDSRDFIKWAGAFRLYHHLLQNRSSQSDTLQQKAA